MVLDRGRDAVRALCRDRSRRFEPERHRAAVADLPQLDGAGRPGNAAAAPGSAFSENGGTAGGVYAGSGDSATTAGSSHAVSRCDVARYQVSQH